MRNRFLTGNRITQGPRWNLRAAEKARHTAPPTYDWTAQYGKAGYDHGHGKPSRGSSRESGGYLSFRQGILSHDGERGVQEGQGTGPRGQPVDRQRREGRGDHASGRSGGTEQSDHRASQSGHVSFARSLP